MHPYVYFYHWITALAPNLNNTDTGYQYGSLNLNFKAYTNVEMQLLVLTYLN